jgi:hypothetical protein
MQPANDSEAEKASNSYLMSLIALMIGMPLPIVNLLATLGFYLGNRRSPYFVRWHCTQALLSQLLLFPLNSIAFWWTVNVLFFNEQADNTYIAYLITLFLFNLIEFITTMRSAILTRKGKHVEWWFVGGLSHLVCKA